ncbi:MAG: sulfate adenylyltransferase [Pseudolabrys sp.]|nr:sulfate adenylyltransferase [Pseudolabrys sp.]
MSVITNTTSSATVSQVPPHGGRLVQRLLEGADARALLARAAKLPRITLDARGASDAELIATGALSPLEGFIGQADYDSILTNLRLSAQSGGHLFSLPITLSVAPEVAATLREGQEAALVHEGEIVGVIDVRELYALDRPREAELVYRTTDLAHPGVKHILSRGDEIGVAGPITLGARTIARRFPEHHRDPAEVRALLAQRGWRRTVAFQTRNPIHRAHEHLLRSALETVDGLAVHPLVGETKDDDVPADVRVRAYEVLLERYFPKDRVLLTVFPFAMRYAGPREAILHAIARQNYGFSHFIVGRDHAGVGTYYGTYDAQKIFDEVRPGELAIVPIFFEHSFYCNACAQVASFKTCPHDKAQHLVLSGTKVREKLARGEGLPIEFTRPEVAAILGEAYAAQAARRAANGGSHVEA